MEPDRTVQSFYELLRAVRHSLSSARTIMDAAFERVEKSPENANAFELQAIGRQRLMNVLDELDDLIYRSKGESSANVTD